MVYKMTMQQKKETIILEIQDNFENLIEQQHLLNGEIASLLVSKTMKIQDLRDINKQVYDAYQNQQCYLI